MPNLSNSFRQELRKAAAKFETRPLRKMSTATAQQGDVDSFREYLSKSKRVLAICGAGLSASAGLPTFRGAGGYWREHDAISLATPEAFNDDPSLVWQFYNYRRHMSLKAAPSEAHHSLAEFARRKPDFLTITQNVDGLSPRAGHPSSSIAYLHGSLSTIKCTDFDCDYIEHDNFVDPIVPALRITDGAEDISSAKVPLKDVAVEDLPHCPKCKTSLLRPGVVWFGEALPGQVLHKVDAWIADPQGIDLLLVIGTSATVYPAASYIMIARGKGARVATINMEPPDTPSGALYEGDWFFQGDAAEILPKLLVDVIGN